MLKRLFQKRDPTLLKSDRRKVILFFGSLIFSVCFWLLFSLSKTYTFQEPALLHFKNVQVRKGLSLPPTKLVTLKLEGTGWELFHSNSKSHSLNLEADLAGHKAGRFISLKDFIPDFNFQIPPGQRILDITPDTIRYAYQHRQYKKIPLIYRYEISFEKQFYYLNPIKNSTDSIVVSGPPGKLNHVMSWETPIVELKELNHSIDTLLSLTDRRYPEFNPEPSSIKFSVHVDQFTEKVITLPIRAINATKEERFILIPSTIQLYILVPLTYYNTVRPELFDVVCDLDEWRISRHSKLVVKVKHAPDFVRIEKISPPDIDFMIHK